MRGILQKQFKMQVLTKLPYIDGKVKVIGNDMVDIKDYISFNPQEIGITEKLNIVC